MQTLHAERKWHPELGLPSPQRRGVPITEIMRVSWIRKVEPMQLQVQIGLLCCHTA
jgi:hypothetical protein